MAGITVFLKDLPVNKLMSKSFSGKKLNTLTSNCIRMDTALLSLSCVKFHLKACKEKNKVALKIMRLNGNDEGDMLYFLPNCKHAWFNIVEAKDNVLEKLESRHAGRTGLISEGKPSTSSNA